MKVVLVHPPLLNVLPAATPDFVDKNRGFTPPLGLLYIQAAIERSRHTSIFLDANLEGWTHKETAYIALSHNPHIIGIQAMTFTMPDVVLLVREIQKISPHTDIVIGGVHPTLYPEETELLGKNVYAMQGESERGFIDWLNVYPLSLPPTNPIELDALPFPARHASKWEKYTSVLAERNPITTMITSRGCPYQCIFCNRCGKTYRQHSSEYVLREFEEIERLNIPEVFIHDDTFTIDKDRVVDICNGLVTRRSKLIWEARTRADCITKELAFVMRSAGCRRLSFGVESGSPKVLELMKKGVNLKQIENAFKWCKEVGIKTLADFMIGNYGETLDDVKMTMDFMHKLDPDYAQFSICSPYPNTQLYDLAREKGLFPTDIWKEFANNPLQRFESPVWEEHFTRKELVSLTKQAYRSFYMQPKFIWKQLLKIKSWDKLKTMARGAIGILK